MRETLTDDHQRICSLLAHLWGGGYLLRGRGVIFCSCRSSGAKYRLNRSCKGVVSDEHKALVLSTCEPLCVGLEVVIPGSLPVRFQCYAAQESHCARQEVQPDSAGTRTTRLRQRLPEPPAGYPGSLCKCAANIRSAVRKAHAPAIRPCGSFSAYVTIDRFPRSYDGMPGSGALTSLSL